MALRLYIADPADSNWPINPTTALLDLNGFEQGDPLGFMVVDDIDFGEVPVESSMISQTPFPGSVQASRRHDLTEMEMRLYLAPHGDYPTLRKRVVDLAEALDQHGVIVYEYSAGLASVYIDYLPSSVSAILHGDERGTQRVVAQFMDPEGYPVRITRQPYFRLGPKTGSNVALSGPSRTIDATNNGNVPALCWLRITPDASAQMVQARVAVRSRGDLTEYKGLAFKELEGSDSALAGSSTAEATTGGTTAAGSTGASGSNALKTIMGGGTRTYEHYRRWYQTIIPSDPRSIEGRFRVFFGVRVWQALEIQLKYGFTRALTQPCELNGTPDPIPVAPSGTFAQSVYTEVDMGLVTVPIGSSELRLEGWAGDPTDTASGGSGLGGAAADPPLWWDYYRLEPADEQNVILSSPGFRSGGVASRSWKPKDFGNGGLGGAIPSGESYWLLDALNEAAITKPVTGIQLQAGRYEAHAVGFVKDLNNAKEAVGEFRIEGDGGTGTWTTTAGPVTLWGLRDAKFTRFDTRLTFTASTNEKYRYVIQQKLAQGSQGDREVRVSEMTHKFLRTVKSPDNMVSDGFRRQQSIRDGSDRRVWGLGLQGPFLEIPPGDAVVVVTGYEVPPTGYESLDIREPLAKVDPARTYTVRADMIERRMGA